MTLLNTFFCFSFSIPGHQRLVITFFDTSSFNIVTNHELRTDRVTNQNCYKLSSVCVSVKSHELYRPKNSQPSVGLLNNRGIIMQIEGKPKFLKHHDKDVRGIAFSPKDRYIFTSGGGDGKINIYNALNASVHALLVSFKLSSPSSSKLFTIFYLCSSPLCLLFSFFKLHNHRFIDIFSL